MVVAVSVAMRCAAVSVLCGIDFACSEASLIVLMTKLFLSLNTRGKL